MSAALFTVPIIGILSWLTLIALGVWRYHGSVVEQRQKAERYRDRVLKEAESLDATLIEQLLDAVRADDLLRHYLKDRAGLVPGLALENPAAWRNEDLNDLVAGRFREEVRHERRRFWVFVVVSLAGSLGAILVIGAVLYHFHRDADGTTNLTIPGLLPSFTVPQFAPQPDAGQWPSSANPSLPVPTSPVPTGASPKSDGQDVPSHDPLPQSPDAPQPKVRSRSALTPGELPA